MSSTALDVVLGEALIVGKAHRVGEQSLVGPLGETTMPERVRTVGGFGGVAGITGVDLTHQGRPRLAARVRRRNALSLMKPSASAWS